MKIGLIGGTGPQGQGLALRLAMAGHEIKIGSRNLEKAQRIVNELNKRIDDVLAALELIFPEKKLDSVEKEEFSTPEELELAKKNIVGMQNEDAVKNVEVVLLTIPFEYAMETLEKLLPNMNPGTILADVTVPLKKVGKSFTCEYFEEGSGSQHLATIVPESIPVVAAFKTVSAHRLLHVERPLEGIDAFVAADKKDPRNKIIELANSIRNLRGINAGTLISAASLEMMTAVLITINTRYKTKQSSFRVTI
ncbi:MAG: NAD(P)-binding domain-containing protein [Candidatus Hermodarchaeota archaeon]